MELFPSYLLHCQPHVSEQILLTIISLSRCFLCRAISLDLFPPLAISLLRDWSERPLPIIYLRHIYEQLGGHLRGVIYLATPVFYKVLEVGTGAPAVHEISGV